MVESGFDEAVSRLSAEGEGTSPANSSQELPSRDFSYQLDGQKEKRQPTITPRKFRRFFTPRSHTAIVHSSSNIALKDITTTVNNRDGVQSSPIRPPQSDVIRGISPSDFTRKIKRRKLFHTPTQPIESSSLDENTLPIQFSKSEFKDLEDMSYDQSSPCSKMVKGDLKAFQKQNPAKDLRKYRKHLGSEGIAGQLLQLNIGYGTGSSRQIPSGPISDWKDQTARFYSLPEDTHFCTSIENPARSIPFCVASCNTNSLVAVGDEEGQVRLLKSAKNGKPNFKDVFLAFRPHSNAVIDLSFSLDDSILATASGDQTARVIDMTTQSIISVLTQHTASLKQVRFQPGAASKSVIATSSRDGSIRIWDLRCKGADGPVLDIHVPPVPSATRGTFVRKTSITYGCIVKSICGAHRPTFFGRQPQLSPAIEVSSRGEVSGRIGDVSVTAITFLPDGREHMLLSASEANASVKLWDLRCLHNTRQKAALPLSCTVQPDSHTQWRRFGINSLNLGGDGSRFYALCRDSTVYVYSTTHLILGHAPESSNKHISRPRQPYDVQESLGPLYGFRHPQLHATSFYVKSAIRTASADKCEMLAVGSCDGCTLLFPTDERYLKQQMPFSESQFPIMHASRRTSIDTADSPRYPDSISISYRGTPLIRGHDREVGALTWTSGGELVTVGDDFLVRCWREGDPARELRTNGEHGGQRWGCGWANVPESYDSEDEGE